MYRKLSLTAIAFCVLIASCEHILGSKKKIDRLPLESAVRFHIGYPMFGGTERSLFVWVTKGILMPCQYLRGSLEISFEKTRIELSIDEIEAPRVICSGVFMTATNEWSLPYLPPAKYDFELELRYPGGYTVTDRYTIQIIDSESLVVTPIAADSSEYSATHLWNL